MRKITLFIIASRNMGKLLLLPLLTVSLTLSVIGCSNDDESCFCDSNIIGTISETGVVNYSSIEKRWFISSQIGDSQSTGESTFYFPISLSKEYQFEGIHVYFKGDIYDYNYRNNDGTITIIAGTKAYCIDLIQIRFED